MQSQTFMTTQKKSNRNKMEPAVEVLPVKESSYGVGVSELVTGSLNRASSVDAGSPPVGPAGYEARPTPAMAESRLERPQQEETC